MKKLLFSVMLMATVFASAQMKETFGIKLGLNTTSISSYKVQLGSSVGMFSEIMPSKMWGFQPELFFSIQSIKHVSQNPSTEELFTQYYMSFPLLAKYHITKTLSVAAGPQIDVLLGAKWEQKNYGDSSSLPNKETLKHTYFYNAVVFGADFGLEYRLAKHVALDARYLLGLSHTFRDDTTVFPGISDARVKKGVFQFSIAYIF